MRKVDLPLTADPTRDRPNGDRIQAVHHLAELIMASKDLFVLVDEHGAVVHANFIEPDPSDFAATVLEHIPPDARRDSHWRGMVSFDSGSEPLVFDVQMTGRIDSRAIHARDITESVHLQNQLAHLATHDALTDLPNRALLVSSLEDSVERAHARHTNVAVLYVDIDDLKRVNDTIGHERGDAVIAEISRRLSAATRPGDLVARIGGDEFVVLCESVDDERAATDIAERIRLAAAGPMPEADVDISVSVGVVLYTGIDGTKSIAELANSLLREADKAMYDAKAHGKSRCWVHSEQASVEGHTDDTGPAEHSSFPTTTVPRQ